MSVWKELMYKKARHQTNKQKKTYFHKNNPSTRKKVVSGIKEMMYELPGLHLSII